MTFDPDDPRLTAFALGELDDAERAEVEALLRDDDEARRSVEEARDSARLLTEALRDEPMPGLSIVQRIELDDRLRGPHARGLRRILVAAAASLALAFAGFGVGRFSKPDPAPDVAASRALGDLEDEALALGDLPGEPGEGRPLPEVEEGTVPELRLERSSEIAESEFAGSGAQPPPLASRLSAAPASGAVGMDGRADGAVTPRERVDSDLPRDRAGAGRSAMGEELARAAEAAADFETGPPLAETQTLGGIPAAPDAADAPATPGRGLSMRRMAGVAPGPEAGGFGSDPEARGQSALEDAALAQQAGDRVEVPSATDAFGMMGPPEPGAPESGDDRLGMLALETFNGAAARQMRSDIVVGRGASPSRGQRAQIAAGGRAGELAGAEDATSGKQASVVEGNTIVLQDATVDEPPKRLAGHGEAIESLSIDPTGRQVLSVDSGRNVFLWDADSGALLNRIAVDGDRFLPPRFDRGGDLVFENVYFGARDVPDAFEDAERRPAVVLPTRLGRVSPVEVTRRLAEGEGPVLGGLRVERLVNAAPAPARAPDGEEPVALEAEVAGAPWSPSNRLVRLGWAAAGGEGRPDRIEDARLLVEFNPSRVDSYRVIGLDDRPPTPIPPDGGRWPEQAVEPGASNGVLIEVVPRPPVVAGVPLQLKYAYAIDPDLGDELLTANWSYRDAGEAGARSIERAVRDDDRPFARASAPFRLAAAAAWVGLALRGSSGAPIAALAGAEAIVDDLPSDGSDASRVFRDRLLELIDRSRSAFDAERGEPAP